MASINDSTQINDWSVGGIKRRDFQADKSGPEVMPHRKKKGKAKPRPTKKPGCAGNDGKAHIYVYIKYVVENVPTYSWYGSERFRKECLGCGRKDRIRYNYFPDESLVYETRHIKNFWELWS
jgi:hypothetical protein